jgi:hypothetical protein
MKDKPKEILSSCCAFGSGCEEVHANKCECPISRQLGSRTNGDSEEVTCYYRSPFSGVVVPRCEHYNGILKVKRNGRTEYKIVCAAQ